MNALIFSGMDSILWLIASLLLIATSVGLIIWLYRYERTLIPPFAGYLLMILRGIVLLLILLLLLQPTWSWSKLLKDSTKVLIAVDVSDSMELIDRQRTPEEILRWKSALGIASSSTSTESDLESDSGLQVVDSNSVSQMNRFQLARQLLLDPKLGLNTKLSEIATVQWAAFALQSETIQPDRLYQQRGEIATDLIPQSTSLGQVLQKAGQQSDYHAIVLLSDGVDTSNSSTLDDLMRFGGISAPVHCVVVGSEQIPKDLAIDTINAPGTVYKNDRPIVRVNLQTTGYEGTPFQVSLVEIQSGEKQQKQVVASGAATELEFQLSASDPGRKQYRVDVETQQDEEHLENNSQEFSVMVIDDSTHVLLIDHEGRWEFRFLEAAFEKDDRVEVHPILFRQPYMGLLPTPFFDNSLGNEQSFEDRLNQVDVIILGDLRSDDLSESQWELLAKFVDQSGGTIVFSSGKRNFANLSLNPTVRKLLPIQSYTPIEITSQPGNSPINYGFHWLPTSEGASYPMLKLTDALEDQAIWRQLPGHTWGLAGRPKPAATLLARADQAASSESGIFVMHNYGLGRVVWLGIDSTWRWRYRSGDRYHYKFWGQLCRWATDLRTMANSGDVQFGPDQPEIRVGESTLIRARWTRLLTDQDEPQTTVEVYERNGLLNQEPIRTLPLKSSPSQRLIQQTELADLPVGEYRLVLKSDRLPESQTEPLEAYLYVIPSGRHELSRLDVDLAALTELSEKSGGALWQPDQMDQLVKAIQPEEITLEEKHDIPLWNHWGLFVMIMLTLAGEWLLRKWHGLP